jgi:hypothetical protein
MEDVGVDFHEEIAPDDHRFEFRVVDVAGDDRAAGGDFLADELRGDLLRDPLREPAENAGRVGAVRRLVGAGVLFVEVVADDVVLHVRDLGAAHVFADGDEFHFGRNDALARVVELGDRCAFGRAQRLAAFGGEAGEFLEAVGALGLRGVFGVFLGEVAVVLRLHRAALIFLDVVAGENPVAAEGGKALLHGAGEGGIAPRAGAVIDPDGVVFFDPAVE